MQILVLNTGSSSIKYDVYDAELRRIAGGETERIATDASHGDAIDRAIADVFERIPERDRLSAIGHRVVHGGSQLIAPVVIDDRVEAAIAACSVFAPLHNPVNLRGIRAARKRFPALPHVAVFDTAFHATLSPAAYLYGLPYALYEDHGLRRFGFHGPSHRYLSERAAAVLGGDPATHRVITCHLGSGASLAAIAGGVSIDTSMGLTPLEGLVMATRPGDLDPSIPGVLRGHGYGDDQLAELFNHQAGLAGLSGLGGDIRDIEAAADRGHTRAKLALDVFVHRVRKYLGAYLVALGGCDALVFAGGVGEHSAGLRARICAGLDGLGIAIDPERNAAARPADHAGLAEVTRSGARTRILVVHTEEELVIARDVAACLAPAR